MPACVRLLRTHVAGLRITHWLYAVLLAGMWWSGLLIYWADRPNSVQFGTLTVSLRYPEVVYEASSASGRLTLRIAWHPTLVWLFVANAAVYAALLLLRSRWRRLVPQRFSLAEAAVELRHLRRRPAVR